MLSPSILSFSLLFNSGKLIKKDFFFYTLGLSHLFPPHGPDVVVVVELRVGAEADVEAEAALTLSPPKGGKLPEKLSIQAGFASLFFAFCYAKIRNDLYRFTLLRENFAMIPIRTMLTTCMWQNKYMVRIVATFSHMLL